VWEPNLTAWIARRLKVGDVFVDVGANIGYFSLLASKLVGETGRVVAIEASPHTFGLLRRNLDLNKAHNVRAVNVAVSDREEILQMFLPPGNDSGRTTVVQSSADQQRFTPGPLVRARPLAAILETREIQTTRLIKIDVEGHEGQVLPSILRMLQSCRADVEVIVEITPSRFQGHRKTSKDLLARFASLGFHFYEIENEYTVGSYLLSKRLQPPTRLANVTFTDQKDLIFLVAMEQHYDVTRTRGNSAPCEQKIRWHATPPLFYS
jgi:FkbM family methyltransferase